MLEKAIIDAEALRESAVKNAEQAIIDKYSDQIKEAVDSLLDEEEMDPSGNFKTVTLHPDTKKTERTEIRLTMPPQEPEGGPGGPAEEPQYELPGEGEPEAEEGGFPPPEGEEAPMFESRDLDLNELENYVRLLEGKEPLEEDGGAEEFQIVDEPASSQLAELDPQALADDYTGADNTTSEDSDWLEEDLEEEIYESILEELEIDEEVRPHGHAGAPTESELEEAEDVAEIQAMLDEKDEENEDLKEQIINQNRKLSEFKKRMEKYKNISLKLKEHLTAVNVSNAKLLYTNKVLSSTSLNERQKSKIVEAISKTETVNEAKVIYETLQSSVGSSEKKRPESLNEAVSRKPSLFLSRRQEKKQPQDPTTDRWKELAGIN